MKNKKILLALCLMCFSLAACSGKNENTGAQQTASSTVTENVQTNKPTETAQPPQTTSAPTTAAQTVQTTASIPELSEAAQPEKNENTTAEQSESKTDALTEDQALNAIKNYCFIKNPDLKNMADSNEYTIYWDVSTNASNEIVVMYRSYTGAQIRYYIEPVSGEAYVTEFVQGITDGEQRTEESLNVRDYLS